MQYYIKIYNTKTNTCVGYYKDIGKTRITRYPNGMKYFNSINEALPILLDIDDSFIRDTDGHYYTCFAVIKSDSKRQYNDKEKNKKFLNGEDRDEYVKNFIRQDFGENTRETGDDY